MKIIVVQVVDNLNAALSSSTTEAKNTPKPVALSNVKPSTKSSSVSSATTKQSIPKSSTQVKPKENENKPEAEPSTPTSIPSTPASTLVPSPSSSSNSTQEPAEDNGDVSKPQEEPKKGGILDHIFHHNH